MKLFAKIAGRGYPVIALHGLFGSLENLGVLTRPLSESFTVHALDLRNHGRSPHCEIMDYHAMAQDVLTYMDGNGLQSAHLLGHSMGGKVAMMVALLNPARVSKLVVLDIAPVTYTERRHLDIFAGLQAINLHTLTDRKAADQQLAEYEPDANVRAFLLKNLHKNEDGQFRWRLGLDAIVDQYSEILAFKPPAKAQFDKPVLFVKGADSNYIVESHREQVMALFPTAQLKAIQHTGHWLHAQKPVQVLHVMERFLSHKNG